MKLQGGYSSDGWMYLFILPILSMGTFGWAFVTAAAFTALRRKFLAAVFMLTLMLLLGVLNIAAGWVSMSGGVTEAMRITLSCIAAGVMGVTAAIQIHRDER
jgi:hypothetical protein